MSKKSCRRQPFARNSFYKLELQPHSAPQRTTASPGEEIGDFFDTPVVSGGVVPSGGDANTVNEKNAFYYFAEQRQSPQTHLHGMRANFPKAARTRSRLRISRQVHALYCFSYVMLVGHHAASEVPLGRILSAIASPSSHSDMRPVCVCTKCTALREQMQ